MKLGMSSIVFHPWDTTEERKKEDLERWGEFREMLTFDEKHKLVMTFLDSLNPEETTPDFDPAIWEIRWESFVRENVPVVLSERGKPKYPTIKGFISRAKEFLRIMQ